MDRRRFAEGLDERPKGSALRVGLGEGGVRNPARPWEPPEPEAPWRNLCGPSEGVLFPPPGFSLLGDAEPWPWRECTGWRKRARRWACANLQQRLMLCLQMWLGLPWVGGYGTLPSTLLRTDFQGLVF